MKPTITITLLFAMVFSLNAQTFVKVGATGNGTSWEDATNLIDALKDAKSGTEIWVAEGTYSPTSKNDRHASFEMKEGVKLHGGFAGNETSLDQRNISNHITILSGEIGQPGIADNSYTVVYIGQVSNQTILDGFVITAGNANGETEEGSRSRCGGGLFIDGANGVSKPVITNCTFKSNYGRDGAAVYNNGRNGESSPSLAACTFTDNEAGLDGGAIYNDGRKGGVSKPSLKNCNFERNVGTYGGAIFNATESGVCNLYLESCSFTENTAYLRGGAVFNMSGSDNCYLELLDCMFSGNYPDDQSKVVTNASGSNAYQISKP